MSSLSLLLSVLVVAMAAGMSLLRPIHAVTLWALMFPLEQALQVNTTFFYAYGSAFNYACAGGVLLAAARQWLSGRAFLAQIINPASVAMLGLLGVATLSISWSLYRSHAEEQFWWNLPYLLVATVAVPLCFSGLRSMTPLRSSIMFLGCILAAAILVSPSFSYFATRARLELGGGQSGSPLALAEAGGLMIVCAALGRCSDGLRAAVLLRATAAILGAGLCLTSGSRGQLIAALATSFLLFPFARRVGNARGVLLMFLAVPVVLGLAYLSMSLFVTSDNLKRWSADSITGGTSERLDFVRSYFDLWVRSPSVWLLGFGSMSFGSLVSVAHFVENLNAEILFEEGLVGFTLYMALLGLVARDAVFLGRYAVVDGQDRANLVTLVGVMLYFLLIASKSFNVWTAHPFWMWLLVTAAIATHERRRLRSEALAPASDDPAGDARLDATKADYSGD